MSKRTATRASSRCASSRASRTPKKRRDFLAALAETGNVLKSCKRAKVGRRTVYDWRETDPEFATLWDAAAELGTDALEDEAVRRATDGVTKPIYQLGKKVGAVREYSDTLLIFLLKGRRPKKYRDHIKIDANVTGGVLCVGARSAKAEDWKKKYDKAG